MATAMQLISMRVPPDLVDRVREHLPPGTNFSAFTRQLLLAWIEEQQQQQPK